MHVNLDDLALLIWDSDGPARAFTSRTALKRAATAVFTRRDWLLQRPKKDTKVPMMAIVKWALCLASLGHQNPCRWGEAM
jgi:hypothetical protein